MVLECIWPHSFWFAKNKSKNEAKNRSNAKKNRTQDKFRSLCRVVTFLGAMPVLSSQTSHASHQRSNPGRFFAAMVHPSVELCSTSLSVVSWLQNMNYLWSLTRKQKVAKREESSEKFSHNSNLLLNLAYLGISRHISAHLSSASVSSPESPRPVVAHLVDQIPGGGDTSWTDCWDWSWMVMVYKCWVLFSGRKPLWEHSPNLATSGPTLTLHPMHSWHSSQPTPCQLQAPPLLCSCCSLTWSLIQVPGRTKGDAHIYSAWPRSESIYWVPRFGWLRLIKMIKTDKFQLPWLWWAFDESLAHPQLVRFRRTNSEASARSSWQARMRWRMGCQFYFGGFLVRL